MAKPTDFFTGVIPPAAAASAHRARNTARDGRKTYVPAEVRGSIGRETASCDCRSPLCAWMQIPVVFQTGRRRFEAERPVTIEAQRRREQSGNGFAAEASSYFPKIRESQTARDTRDQKNKFASHVVYMDAAVSKQCLLPRRSRPNPGNEIALTTAARPSRSRQAPEDYSGSPSIVMNLGTCDSTLTAFASVHTCD